MEKKLRLEIVTPYRIMSFEDISMLIVRSVEGEIGILFNHAPLIAVLEKSVAKLKMIDGSVQYINIAGGFLEVRYNNLSIVTSAAETPGEIDVKRAEESRKRALERLKVANKNEDVDKARAEAALKRAVARLKAAQYNKQS